MPKHGGKGLVKPLSTRREEEAFVNRNRRWSAIGVFLLSIAVSIAAAFGAAASAQEVTANFVGVVADASGAAIPGAKVTATDVDRGTESSAMTNANGEYTLQHLPVGTYRIKVEKAGFETANVAAVTLVLNRSTRVDVQMKVGSVSESVEVSATAPELQTQSEVVSTLIDSNTAENLPLTSRNYIQLALLAPGATTNNPDALKSPHIMTDEGRPYINGNREQAIEFFLDGIINDEEKNNEVAYQPNLDAIQEFNIITQNPGADFGNYAGGVISVTTKSGTNQYHGDVFEYLRNDFFDAEPATENWGNGFAAPSRLRYNMFGGTAGGPILKNKLFFFGDYQGMRFPTAGGQSAQLLTTPERAGDFSDYCVQGGGSVSASGCSNPTYSIYDPVHGAVAPYNCLAATCNGNPGAGDTPSPIIGGLTGQFSKYYPAPTTDNALGDNINFVAGNRFDTDQGDLRTDYNMSEKDKIFNRYSKWDVSRSPFSTLPFSEINAINAAVPADQPGWSDVINWTHMFSPNVLNEARLGINVFRFYQNITLTSPLGPIANEMLGESGNDITTPNGQQGGLPFLQFGGNFSPTVGSDGKLKYQTFSSASLGDPMIMQTFLDTEIQYEDNVMITRGRHSFNTGFQFIRERNNWIYAGNDGALGTIAIGNSTENVTYNPDGTINTLTAGGNQLGDFWLGDVAPGGGRDSGLGGGLKHYSRGSIISAFFQDDWRVTDSFTVNLGLRFEDHTPIYDAQNHVVNFGLYTGQIETPDPSATGYSERALYNNYTGVGDFDPRIGFAWNPSFLGRTTVIRAAYGVSEYREGGGANEDLQMNLPYGTITQGSPATTGVQALNSNFSWPTLPTNCTVPQYSCYAGSRIRVYPANFRPAINQQWNLSIQHQINRYLTAQVGYVGQKGTHLINFEDLAQEEGLNANGAIAQPGQLITQVLPGPYLGGQAAGASPANNIYYADNPDLGGAEALAGANMDNGNSRYDSLQAVLVARNYHGLAGQVAYTYSKCLSDSPGYFGVAGGGWTTSAATQSSSGIYGTENIYDPRADWGPCYYDQTHILSSYLTYAVPFGKGRQFGSDMSPVLNALIGNWNLSGIVSAHSGNALTLNYFGGWGATGGGSGLPPAISAYGDESGTNGIGPYTLSELPSCNGPINILNKFVPGTGGSSPYIQWFDTTNISAPAAGTFGTCGVGNIRGPRDQDWDLSLSKDFAITESKRLQFRMDVLNAFNYTHWTFAGSVSNGSFTAGGGSSYLGQIVGSQGSRELEFALKFFF